MKCNIFDIEGHPLELYAEDMADIGFPEADRFVEADKVGHAVVGDEGYPVIAQALSFTDSVFQKRAADALPSEFREDGESIQVVFTGIGFLF